MLRYVTLRYVKSRCIALRYYCGLICGSNKMNMHLNKFHKLQMKYIRLITFSDYIAQLQS